MYFSCVPLRLHRQNRALFKPGLRGIALAAIIIMMTVSPITSAQTEAKLLTPKHRADIEGLIRPELQRSLNKMKRLKGQDRTLIVKVALDSTGEKLTIDPGRGFIPKGDTIISGALEEQMQLLNTTALHLLDGTVPITEFEYLFDGKDIYYFFPDEKLPNPKPAPRKVDLDRMDQASMLPAKIVISSGHGWYHNYDPSIGWTLQRDPYNGMTEDLITPFHALDLETWFITRSQAETHFVRSQSSDIYAPPNAEWWQVAARYHLQQVYPNNPEIWNSMPRLRADDREMDEDIRSRPLFANHIAADTLISLHTNGSKDTSVRGAEVWTQTLRPSDRALGNSILCYMKEIVQAQDGYTTYPVRAAANIGNYGENRVATMRAAIVEIGYHTNAIDAAALQDPAFREAAMKGVEKGYRLYEQGQPCKPFKITSIAAASGNHSTSVPVKVHYEGFPEFSVKAKVEITNCPDSTCHGGELIIPAVTASPLTWYFACNSSANYPTKTIGVRTTLTDIDGVVTNSVESTVTCMKASNATRSNALDAVPMATASAI